MKRLILPKTDQQILGKELQHVVAIESGTPETNYRAINWHNFYDGLPDLKFNLFEGALLTDIIGCMQVKADGFLINSKVKQVIDNFKIPTCRYYPATVYNNGVPNDYWYFHLVGEYIDTINFEKITFEVYDPFTKDIVERINISSYDELKKHYRKNMLKVYRPNKYAFKESMPNDFIFKMGLVDDNIYVTEFFAEKVQEFSGISFKGTTWF